MNAQRRTLIQFAACGTLLTPFLPGQALTAAELSSLSYWQVNASAADVTCQPGDWLLADQTVNRFKGDGIYLYPAWGEPRAYRVNARQGGELEFCSPQDGSLLWRQSLREEDGFAGQVLGHVARDEQATLLSRYELRALTVPALPRPLID